MRTQKQIQASRANGARSRGPVTPEGKQISSRNSTFHGLLAETIVLASESKERFLEMLQSYIDDYHPVTATENALVEKMCVARWQQLRIQGIQKACVDQDMSQTIGMSQAIGMVHATASPDAPPAAKAIPSFRNNPEGSSPMQLLLRYDVAADRQFHRALARLLDLQQRKSAVRTQEVPVGRAPGLQPDPRPASPLPVFKRPTLSLPNPAPPSSPARARQAATAASTRSPARAASPPREKSAA